ncbi:hypothetical protein EHS25_003118 [Saitozyma podzolica]|uniref:Uncharacterized protein n=1 Tax=Saitozyma podzolica TaxID=1890683 RepID=A0A427Y7Z8_9TREE|nr:hypothetical protein EHS25_003118 [Saitozyma podzolica]
MKPETMDPVDAVDTDASWASGREGWEEGGWLASSMGRVVVLGVLILGSLSGFGAGVGAKTRRLLNENDILDAERSLYRVRHEIVSKREEIARESTSAPASDRSWMGRFFSGGEMASLETELRGLQGMEKQASRHVRMLKLRKDFGKTLRGKVYNVIGYVFATYCAARLVMCLPSIFFSTSQIPVDDEGGRGNSNGDWISFLLALAVTRLPTDFDIDIAVWSRMISLLLTGVLILSSLAQVLRSLTRMLRLTSKTVGAGFLLLSLGQLFATYVISLLVQLRTSLPPSPELDTDPFSPFYSNSTLDASGEIFASSPHGLDTPLLASLPDFRVFGRLFDVTFLFAAVATGVYRFFALKVNGDDFAR